MLTIRRFNTVTGVVLMDVAPTERQARTYVAWCAHDNVGMSKRDSSREADALVLGEPYSVGDYVFTIERAS